MGEGPFRIVRRARVARAALLAVMAVSAGAWLCLPAWAGQAHEAPAHDRLSAWQFQADWSAGYAGWMSFPLSQDVGYDPSIYTEQIENRPALVRTFTAHGEKRAWFGFVRPLHFAASTQTSCDIQYELRASGQLADATLIFGAADGHHYSAPLTVANGVHRLHVTGAQLGLTKMAAIVVVTLKVRLLKPTAASTSEWILRTFTLNAERAPSVRLRAPALRESSDEGQVASTVLQANGSLHVAWQTSAEPTRVALFDPSGAPGTTKTIAAGTDSADISLPSPASPGLWRAQVEQGNARTDFHFFVLGEVPAHPRLLLSAERLEQLRGPQYASVRQQIHTRATHLATTLLYSVAAGDNIELMPSGPGIQPAFPDQIKPYFSLMESYSSAVAYNALDYRLNGNAAALSAARRALLTMAKWRTWEPPRFRSHGLQTYYEVGVAAQSVAFGYDLIADQLSAAEKSAVEDAFWKQVIAPAVQEYFTADRDPIGASNFMANSLGGALAASIAVAGDTPEWNERDAPALGPLEFAFERLLDGLLPGDGSEAEPTGYENFAFQGLSWGLSALRAVGVTPRGTLNMLSAFWWPYYDTVSPGMQLDTGDFNGHLTKLPGFAWAAENANIPELRAFYEHDTQLDLAHGATAVNNGHSLEEMSGPLDLVCCSTPAKPFDPPPPSRVFPLRGSAALRSGWAPDSTVISLRVGPWFNHNHFDEGTFQVATQGETVIDEAGYGRYYLDPYYADYFSQAPGHNTLLVDGDPFSQQAINGRYWPGFPHPKFSSTLLAREFNYLNADLSSAYDGRPASYSREYFFVKPGLLVIRDRVKADQPHTYTWLLHVTPGSELKSEGPAASIAAKKAAARLLAIGPNTEWTTQSTPLSIALFDQLDKPAIPPHQELVLTSPKTTASEFIVGMNFGAISDTSNLALTRWTNATGEGLRTAGADSVSMIFRTKPGMLTVANLSTDGDALVQSTKDRGAWLATGAHFVREGNQDLLRSTAAMDVAMEREGATLVVTLHNAAPTVVQVYRSTAPGRVEMDGHEIRTAYANNRIELSLSVPGEHHVTIE